MGSTQWWGLAMRSEAATLTSMWILPAIIVKVIDEIDRKVARIAGTRMVRHASIGGILKPNVLGTGRTFSKRSCNHIPDTIMILF